MRHVVIVGASLAGLRTAEELRAVGFDGPITLVGAERHLPYDRPPLSKQVLSGAWEPARTQLRDSGALGALGVEPLLGRRATGLDRARRVVELSDGASVSYDTLVIATGVDARRLAGHPDHPSVHMLRTLDDSVALRDDLDRATSLLVVGGGFIGAEVAAVARSRGLDVRIVEAQPVPFQRTMGATVGAACARLHLDRGVRIRCGAAVAELVTGDGAVGVRLDDGTVLEADCMVVGVGTVPNGGWLHDSGVGLGNGVLCDVAGRVLGLDDAFAVGDVAAWYDPVLGEHVRVEHWTSATEQAGIVGRAIAGAPALTAAMGHTPYFWSDQYTTKIQLVGRPGLADDVRLLHGTADGDPTLFAYFRDHTLVAAASFGAPGLIARYRPLVAAAAREEDVLEVAAPC